jgi:ABC-2 type transport system ATP-binding protein
VLLLDEPLSKIDPYNRKHILNTILDAMEDHEHIIIASHEIGNLERIIDYAVLIKDGVIISQDSMSNIENKYPDIKEWYREMYTKSSMTEEE